MACRQPWGQMIKASDLMTRPTAGARRICAGSSRSCRPRTSRGRSSCPVQRSRRRWSGTGAAERRRLCWGPPARGPQMQRA